MYCVVGGNLLLLNFVSISTSWSVPRSGNIPVRFEFLQTFRTHYRGWNWWVSVCHRRFLRHSVFGGMLDVVDIVPFFTVSCCWWVGVPPLAYVRSHFFNLILSLHSIAVLPSVLSSTFH